jgi:hypothetical protein
MSDTRAVGAFSPPLRLSGRLLELWAAAHAPTHDDILAPPAGELIQLRPGTPPEQTAGEGERLEDSQPRRAGAPGAMR